MSAHSSDLALLQQIVAKIEIEPIRVGPINLADLSTLPFICAKMSPIGVVGIRVEAATALSELAASIYRNSPSYRRGVTYAALHGELVDVILANFPNRSAAPVTTADVVMVKCKIDAWFQSVAAKREYYVPCVLPPRPDALP